MPPSRQLAAIMFTDIVGYTALMGDDEQKAFSILNKNRAIQKPIIEQFNGRWIKELGDGVLCSFQTVSDAVNAAIKIQEACNTKGDFQLRIGIHEGEVVFDHDDVFGDGVNIAARIQASGVPGSILISKRVNDEIKNKSEFQTISLGNFNLKNVKEPIEVFALTNEGLNFPKQNEAIKKLNDLQKNLPAKSIFSKVIMALFLVSTLVLYIKNSDNPVTNGKVITIAVLPFKNISVNKEENEPFCIGVVLELQKKLQLIGGLIPIAPQSVEKFRDTKLSVADISSELGDVKYLVQGNVLRDKNKVKVFASLVDASSGKLIWSDDYPGEVVDIFSLQENIAQQIASELQVKITPEEQSHISRVVTKSAAAIDAYNDALTSYTKLATAIHPLYWDSLPSNPKLYSEYLKTLSLCDKAIQMDPSMAEAYVLKGKTYMYSIYDWFAARSRTEQVLDSVKVLGTRALAIDKSSADAYLLLSGILNNKDSTEIYLESALAINSNSFEVNRAMGNYYTMTDPEKAIRFYKKAIRLNPLSVWTPLIYSQLGFVYHVFGDFEKAELYGKKAIELSNNSILSIEANRGLTITYLHWGKADSAIKYANQYLNHDDSREANALYEIAEAYCNLKNDCGKAAQLYEELWKRYGNHRNQQRWGVALMNIGKTNEAKEKTQQAMKEYQDRNDTLSYDYAGICAFNGEKAKAMEILRKWDWQWGSVYLVQHDKLFDNLRNDKEFNDLVKNALDKNTKLRERIRKMEAEGRL
jgi:class 3 adenylate cyclase/TolB-like protein/tetratricopeptide (TPR) repeat protein